MRGSGFAIAGEEIEDDQATKSGGSFGRVFREGLIQFGVNGARGWIAISS